MEHASWVVFLSDGSVQVLNDDPSGASVRTEILPPERSAGEGGPPTVLLVMALCASMTMH